MTLDQFLAQALADFQSFGGMTWGLKVSAICLLIVGSIKVSFLNQYVWAKLGAAQVWVAPILGLIGGVLSMSPFSWSGAFAYVTAGAGAVVLHELLESIKAIPGLGAIYVSAIGIIESLLGGSSNPPASS